MKKPVLVARVLLGLALLVFGLDYFLHFLPQQEHGAEATAFLTALGETGYMWPLIKVTEILCGVLLISGQFVPLALVLLAPLMVNFLAFHLVLEPAGLAIPLVLLALQLFLVAAHWPNLRGVLQRCSRSSPSPTDSPSGSDGPGGSPG